jgi:hypothetical protein
MEKLKQAAHNVATGEYIEIDLTATEIAELKAQKEKDAQRETARQAEAEGKAQAKAALLERLGITADEAKLLLGGN